MNVRKTVAIGIASLVLGMAIGGVGSASAVTDGAASSNPIVAGTCGLGLKLGATMRDSGARLADIVATLTGKSVDDVQDARHDGTSFAKIAEDAGVSADKVVAEALDARKAILDAKVKDGTITQDQADVALKNMETRLTERVESTTPGGMGRGMGGGMGRGRGGAGGCGGTCTAATTQQ